MKTGLKITASVLAILISAGCTAMYASNRNVSADEQVAVTQKSVASVSSEERTVSEIKAEKDETVYALADASGNISRTIVSDWLKNPGALTDLNDVSDLTNIQNVKGDETYSADGEELSWQANGSDIYYKGDSSKALPVEMKITYYLDDEEISPSELAGKSGHVVIRYDFTNTDKHEVEINGKTEEIYTPYMLATVTAFDSEKFVNVEVTNGKAYSDGSRTMVIGMAMPGLKESLGLADNEDYDDIEIPEYFEFSADVTDFELETSVTVATGDIFGSLSLSDNVDTDELTDSINELSDASKELCDGAKSLYDGVCELYDGAKELDDGIVSLYDGSVTLKDGAKELYDGTGELSSGAKTLNDGAKSLTEGIASAKDGADSLASGSESIKSGADQISGGLTSTGAGLDQLSGGLDSAAAALDQTSAADAQVLQGLKALYAQTKSEDIKTMITALEKSTAAQKQVSSQLKDGGAIKDGVTSLKEGNTTLLQGANQLSTGAETLTEGAKSLSDGMTELYTGSQSVSGGTEKIYAASVQVNSGAKEVSDGAATLSDGAGKLKDGSSSLIDGISELKDGSKELSDGMNEFDETGIQKIVSALDGDLSDIVERLKALRDISAESNSFSGASEDMDSSVKFIYTTESIKTESDS